MQLGLSSLEPRSKVIQRQTQNGPRTAGKSEANCRPVNASLGIKSPVASFLTKQAKKQGKCRNSA